MKLIFSEESARYSGVIIAHMKDGSQIQYTEMISDKYEDQPHITEFDDEKVVYKGAYEDIVRYENIQLYKEQKMDFKNELKNLRNEPISFFNNDKGIILKEIMGIRKIEKLNPITPNTKNIIK